MGIAIGGRPCGGSTAPAAPPPCPAHSGRSPGGITTVGIYTSVDGNKGDADYLMNSSFSLPVFFFYYYCVTVNEFEIVSRARPL